MKATPQIVADFDEYPELRVLADAAIRRVVELMGIHDISELRRIRKTGVFDHPYDKDIVTPIGAPGVPVSVTAARYTVGKALLDYLESVGIRGISLELGEADVKAISGLWNPTAQQCPLKPNAGTEKPETPAKETQDNDTASNASADKPAETETKSAKKKGK